MSTVAVVERIRDAEASATSLRVRGAGSWIRAGHPVASTKALDLGDDRGIVEYVPGDLTLTARAGTRLSELHAATLAHGQWLPLDPWGGGEGTLGATISTATTGPHSYAMGLPRDVVLGLEFVTGGAKVVRSGGRVVKNVAGYDLTRLVTGSWGTLGVITEATVRLRARPERTRSIAIAMPEADAMAGLATRLRALPFAPLASELLNAALAAKLGLIGEAVLLVQLGGNERSVAAQLDLVAAFGSARDVDDSVWYSLRTADAGAGASWRWSRKPSDFGRVWADGARASREIDGLLAHGNPARGVVRFISPGAAQSPASRAAEFGGTVAIEMLPANAWAQVPATLGTSRLPEAIRERFDRKRILNPGIMGRDT